MVLRTTSAFEPYPERTFSINASSARSNSFECMDNVAQMRARTRPPSPSTPPSPLPPPARSLRLPPRQPLRPRMGDRPVPRHRRSPLRPQPRRRPRVHRAPGRTSGPGERGNCPGRRLPSPRIRIGVPGSGGPWRSLSPAAVIPRREPGSKFATRFLCHRADRSVALSVETARVVRCLPSVFG